MNILTKIFLLIIISNFATTYAAPKTDNRKNRAPSVSVSSPNTADGNTQIVLDGSRSKDRDGTIVGYAWSQTSGSPTILLSHPDMAIASFTAPNITTQLGFTLTVTDNGGATKSKSVSVSIEEVAVTPPVEPINQAPIADAGINLSIDELNQAGLNGSASTDTDGTIVSYSWVQTDGTPSLAINSPNAAIANFLAPSVTSTTVLTFELSVTDNNGAVDTKAASITIYPVVDTPPTASGVATLSWSAPTENTDNSTLTDLAGFKVYYGNAVDQLNDSVPINSLDEFVVIEGLTNEQTYYFAVVACNSIGVESELSNISSTFIY